MKRFILSLIIVSALVVGGACLLNGVKIVTLQKDIDKIYTLLPDQTRLFLGSSQMGCSIIGKQEYHNKVIWSSGKTPFSMLMRLKELERRHQLTYVKDLYLYFNAQILNFITHDRICLSAYQELPLSWRYLDCFPVSNFDIVKYIAANQRLPIRTVIDEKVPLNRPVVTIKTERLLSEFKESARATGASLLASGLDSQYDEALKRTYLDIEVICNRHNIRLHMLQFKMHPDVEGGLSNGAKLKMMEYNTFFASNNIDYVELPQSPESWFSDIVHLNDGGAEAFSKMLFYQLSLLETDGGSDSAAGIPAQVKKAL